MNYFELIRKYIPYNSRTYPIYVIHVSLVTAKALQIARQKNLSRIQIQFIEEAGMLHDIGICRVHAPSLGCNGNRPYLWHGVAGRKILEKENLPRHALVAERHVGLGLTKQEIIQQRLPLPQRDMLPESIAEKIICWADLFFSKRRNRLWEEKSFAQVRTEVSKYGKRQSDLLQHWKHYFAER